MNTGTLMQTQSPCTSLTLVPILKKKYECVYTTMTTEHAAYLAIRHFHFPLLPSSIFDSAEITGIARAKASKTKRFFMTYSLGGGCMPHGFVKKGMILSSQAECQEKTQQAIKKCPLGPIYRTLLRGEVFHSVQRSLCFLCCMYRVVLNKTSYCRIMALCLVNMQVFGNTLPDYLRLSRACCAWGRSGARRNYQGVWKRLLV